LGRRGPEPVAIAVFPYCERASWESAEERVDTRIGEQGKSVRPVGAVDAQFAAGRAECYVGPFLCRYEPPVVPSSGVEARFDN
jgi:hypothetical protein